MITLLCLVLGFISFVLAVIFAGILLVAGVPVIAVVIINSVLGWLVVQGLIKLWKR